MAYFATYHNNGSDTYIFGPFPAPPTDDEVMALLRKHAYDDAVYLEEMGDGLGSGGSPFRHVWLPDEEPGMAYI